MEHTSEPAYGLWVIVLLNTAVILAFAFSFTRPSTRRDWKSFGAFSAFVVALFAEMYGFPLTIYLLSGWLINHYPEVDFMLHDNGHLWHTLLKVEGDPHWGVFHIGSLFLTVGGFIMLASAWKTLLRAKREGQLAVTGLYARLRHPQYVALILIMFGFLLQWPTLVTVVMFPILVFMYWRLAKREEAEARATFGSIYEDYAQKVPAFIPKFSRKEFNAARLP